MVSRISGVALLSVVLSVGACSGASGEGASPQGRVDPAAARRAEAALDEARTANEQLQGIEAKLKRRCMVAQGFTVFPPDPPSQPDSHSSDDLPPSLADARTAGYRYVPASPADGTAQGNSTWAQATDEYKQRYTVAELGDQNKVVSYDFGQGTVSAPADGCAGKVLKSVMGDMKEYVRLEWIAGNEVRNASLESTLNDPEVQRTRAQWSQCLAGKGVQAQSRSDVADLTAALYTPATLHNAALLKKAKAAEIALAVKDATCADSSGLRTTWSRVRAEQAASFLTEHEKDLVAWRQAVRAALARADTLLKTT